MGPWHLWRDLACPARDWRQMKHQKTRPFALVDFSASLHPGNVRLL